MVFFSDPYSINLARPLAKGFEQLRPGVIGFSQGRRDTRDTPFCLKFTKKKEERKSNVNAVGIFTTSVLFSIVGLLVLFFGRWPHWVSIPSHTNHVNSQGEGNPRNSPPCCHGVYDLNCATDIKGRHWDLKSESLLNKVIVTRKQAA